MGDLLFKCLPVFLVKLYFYHYMFTSVNMRSLIPEPGFCVSGEAGRLQLFYKYEAGRIHGPGWRGMGLSRKDFIESGLVTLLSFL